MPDETTVTETVKATSDGSVKIALEKYNELVDKVATQNAELIQLRSRPPVVNRTTIHKTPEMLSEEHTAWGVTFMLGGAAMLVVGAIRFKMGRS